MRRATLLFGLLAAAAFAWAAPTMQLMLVSQPGAPAGGEDPRTLRETETFDPSGYDLSWTETGAPDEDDGSAHDGAQCLLITSSATTVNAVRTHTGYAKVSYDFWWRFESKSGSQIIAKIRVGATALVTLTVTSGGDLQVQPAGGSTNVTNNNMSSGTWYFVRLEYEKAQGGGGNAIGRAGYSTTAMDGTWVLSATGDQTCAATNGTRTNDATDFCAGSDGAGTMTHRWDTWKLFTLP